VSHTFRHQFCAYNMRNSRTFGKILTDSETITGAVTIRALRKQQQESLKNARLLEANQRVQFSILAANCWLNFRLTVGIGATVIGITTLIAVIQHEYAHVDPALVGLALSYSLPLTGILSAFMRDFLSTELGFISVERISQFSNLPSKLKFRKFFTIFTTFLL